MHTPLVRNGCHSKKDNNNNNNNKIYFLLSRTFMNEKDNNAHLRMLLLNDNNACLQMLLWNKGHVILVPIIIFTPCRSLLGVDHLIVFETNRTTSRIHS